MSETKAKKSGWVGWMIAIGTGGLAFASNKAISKMNSIQSMGADKYPGFVPFIASSAMTGGAIAMRTHIKDDRIKNALIIGSGIASFERLLNVDMVKKNLPPQVQNLLSGDEDRTVVKATPEQLEQIMKTEVERQVRQLTASPQISSETVTEENLEGDPFEYRTVGEDDDEGIFR